ncbi:MAG: RecQ family ATP-dependent DNA helicase [Desulfobulbus sp.]|nr:RecQ family ATP-dependent DNA helicase [Desulfobulbus sp.]
MPVACQDFFQQTLLLDIEVNEKNEIYSLGGVLGEQTFQWSGKRKIDRHLLAEFDFFCRDARFILGHNLLNHDLPRLKQVAPELCLLAKPAIDTLFLSPLAYPANPYHRLIKNYQIVRDSINDPVQDAMLAGKVFSEQWAALLEQLEHHADVVLLYRGLLATEPSLAGTAEALACMGIPLLSGDDLLETFAWFARGHACKAAIEQLMVQLIDGAVPLASLAYVTAWLSVADGNSVLPPWVRHQFPLVPALLHQLRENNCRDEECTYCRTQHDPRRFLQEYYGFADFRPTPASEDGKSLQEAIVRAAAQGSSLFATLPTGGGKSLCYLLPALMRYQRRTLLTIVISPLQALMKDQVDNFSRFTGTKIAAALYGMLTMPERAEVLEGVRLGDIGILLVSPEQLRNASFKATISQREIGAWVFDEAHCLSKWGHDFRPDYLYAIRFIREFAEREGLAIPPVQCFTATAKKDVKAEIIDIIQRELGLRVLHFAGGHERTNLHYEVRAVERYEKYQSVLDLLRTRLEDQGSVVIYCATRSNTEHLAEFLQENGWNAEAFHAGLEPSIKKRIQENFVSGVTPIICATNAFGMGIDKEDVRLVIHIDIPGSLENYLQEAGRAGRDRNAAECILIFNEQDIEGQFRLSASSMLNQRQIAQFLRGLRYAARGENSVVLTAGDLLRLDVVDVDPDLPDGDTRVRTALAWLERAGYLQRNENQTKIFQGKPTHRSLEEAAEKIAGLDLSGRQQQRWLAILGALMERTRLNQPFSADELAGLSAFATTDRDSETESETQRVIRTLHDMAAHGVLEQTTLLSAYIRYKVQHSSEKQLLQVVALENNFVTLLEELAPDVELETHLELDLRQINQVLLDKGSSDCSPHALKLFLYGLSRDGKGMAGNRGSLSFKARGNHRFSLYLHRDWSSLRKTVELRQLAALRSLQAIVAAVPAENKSGANLLVEFSLEQIITALRGDLLLMEKLKDPLAVAERALTFLHEQKVIDLQQGLAVFRQAMTIQLNPETKSKRYSKDDFLPLKTHYAERTFQIHVMNEYARLALGKISGAWQYVASYFEEDKELFLKRFFPGKESFFERATSEQSYQRIVDDLQNPAQEQIVTADQEKNLLVLAGPGAGKTRVVAHRVAYLLRVARINPRAILVLCFNRSAILSLRQRLRALVGEDMAGVTLLTFHGLSLRLTGQSLVGLDRQGRREDVDFSRIIPDAIALLRGEVEVVGLEGMPPDLALVGRFSHILVDEYQDIDADQYELVSLVAGKSREEGEGKLAILTVGDDDQNIYRFRGASVEFIRRFQEDYNAEIHYLVENYRSTAHIIAASNQLITHNTDRMKTGYPIRINTARASLPPGGNWQGNDPLVQGKVQVIEVADPVQQAKAVLEELRRLRGCGPVDFRHCAVLAREWRDLDIVRSVCEEQGLPIRFCWGRQSSFPRLTRVRENADLLAWLRTRRTDSLAADVLLSQLEQLCPVATLWSQNLRFILQQWAEETNHAPQPAAAIEEYLYEVLAEQSRAKSVGEGIFLSTAHSVKGLEFDHVFILGDSWDSSGRATLEDERRLYYVSMSRARGTLCLFLLADVAQPHLASLAGGFLLWRKGVPRIGEQLVPRTYHLLGLEDLFIDFAGLRAAQDPVRQALERMVAGEKVHLQQRKSHLEFIDRNGIGFARLSKKAKEEWAPRLASIREVRVVALVRRYREDVADKELQARCKGERWLVPIVEIIS